MEILLLGVLVLGLIVLANAAEAKKVPAWLVTVALAGLNGLLLLGALGLLILPALPLVEPVEPAAALPPISVGVTLLVTALIAPWLLLPAVRRWLARLVPIKPESPVHLTALVMAGYLICWNLINLLWVGGVEGLQESAETVPVWLVVVQGGALVLVAAVGVGLLIRRSWRDALERLGLGRLHWSAPLIAAASVIVLMAINLTIAGVWMLVDPDQAEAISQISEAMLGDFDSFGTILVLSVVSSVSEEILFRGALQPRLGLGLTSVLFALTHLQYALSPATLIVLLIGFILGLLRRFFGTWTAILSHFGYNFSLLLLGLIASKLLEVLG